jgi:hypothetical protein
MRSRPLSVTIAAGLLVLLGLFGFPFVWTLLFPGVEEPPAFVLYSGLVIGILSLVAAVGLWLMKPWSLWATVVVCVLNVLSGLPGMIVSPTAGIKVTCVVLVLAAVLAMVLVVLPTSRRTLTAS